jgi:glucose/arabinose dehydrogenase
VAAVFSGLFSLSAYADMAQVTALPDNPAAALHVPVGFTIRVFARLKPGGSDFFRGPRFMAFSPAGDLYLSLGRDNKVVMLPDRNHHGVADEVVTVADHLNAPQGLAFIDSKLYVANQDSVVVLPLDGVQHGVKQIIGNLPEGGHTLKTVKLGPDGFLYVSVGSSCNVCNEADPLRATILRYTIEGKPAGALTTFGRHAPTPIWASGLRNTQDYVWHPLSGEMYASNEGADMRSDHKGAAAVDDLPPEHLNVIKAGEHYGWPHCWGDHVNDPNFPADGDFCATMQAPVMTFPAHSTPIGLAFLDKTNFPSEYRSDMLVALHGSWNRQQPSGYKIVRVHFAQNKPVAVSDFATGWLSAAGAWGRPVAVAVSPVDGAVYVSDDRAGLVYRIEYKGETK